MTDFGRRQGDMNKSVYDQDDDGTVDNSEKLQGSNKTEVQDHTPKSHTHTDPPIAHKTSHQTGGSDEINVTGLTGTTPGALLGDGTAGRKRRVSRLFIKDGTNSATLKCQVVNRWNGDAIAETDNIAKGATTGNFTLSADGQTLTIKASGLSGNVVCCEGFMYYNACTIDVLPDVYPSGNDIVINIFTTPQGSAQDITSLANGGFIYIYIPYITDA